MQSSNIKRSCNKLPQFVYRVVECCVYRVLESNNFSCFYGQLNLLLNDSGRGETGGDGGEGETGVDLLFHKYDPHMIQGCTEKKEQVLYSDAIAAWRSVTEKSFDFCCAA